MPARSRVSCGESPRPAAVPPNTSGAVRAHPPHLHSPAERGREDLAGVVARRQSCPGGCHLAEHLGDRSGQLELYERALPGQRTQMFVVDMQVRDRRGRRELRCGIDPEPVDHELVQRFDMLAWHPAVLVQEMLQATLAAGLFESAVPLGCMALTEKATAGSFHTLLVAVADPPSSALLLLVGLRAASHQRTSGNGIGSGRSAVLAVRRGWRTDGFADRRSRRGCSWLLGAGRRVPHAIRVLRHMTIL